jgi:molecular chaperone DnaJ
VPTRQDPYEILGVTRTASDDEIKQAYRALARRYHPDVVRDGNKTDVETKFKRINQAYEVLSDPAKRAQYDRFGTTGSQPGSPGGFGFGGDGIGDIFDMFFGAGGAGGRRGAGPQHGADLRYDLEITLDDVLRGADREIAFDQLGPCDDCASTGSTSKSKPKPCSDCGGSGQLRAVRDTPLGRFVTSAPCARCGGSGHVIADPCKACGGNGRRESRRKVAIKIPKGVESGNRMRFAGQGEAGERGSPPGDLYVYFSVKSHDVFEREGAHLRCETTVSFTQAVLGAKLEIDALDGPAVLELSPGTQPGTTFRIPGRGLPRGRNHERGDLLVDVSLRVPTKLTRKQKELLQEFARAGGDEVDDKGFISKIKEAFAGE